MVKTSGSEQEPRTRDAGHWTVSFQDVEFPWTAETPGEDSASAESPAEAPPAPSDDKPVAAPPPITRRMRRARRKRRRIVIVAAVVAVLLVFGVVAAVALVGRDSGSASGSGAPTTASRERTTVVPTTVAPTTAAPSTVAPSTVAPTTVPPTAASQPGAFTVHATCGGSPCTVAIHQGPQTSAAPAGSLRTGETVQVSCSTHGATVTDRDTGQRSDVWNRLADGRGFVSGLYLQGPAVPNCG